MNAAVQWNCGICKYMCVNGNVWDTRSKWEHTETPRVRMNEWMRDKHVLEAIGRMRYAANINLAENKTKKKAERTTTTTTHEKTRTRNEFREVGRVFFFLSSFCTYGYIFSLWIYTFAPSPHTQYAHTHTRTRAVRKINATRFFRCWICCTLGKRRTVEDNVARNTMPYACGARRRHNKNSKATKIKDKIIMNMNYIFDFDSGIWMEQKLRRHA